MHNENINYKFVFIAIYISYCIAQFAISFYKPELTRYAVLLEIIFFIIPLVIIHYATQEKSTNDSPTTSRTHFGLSYYYKLNFRFNIGIIPCIL